MSTLYGNSSVGTPRVKTGLDRLRAGEGPSLTGRPVALLCHPASVDARIEHLLDIVGATGADIRSLLGPEHGLDAAAQDMEGVDSLDNSGSSPGAEASSPPVYSLYGESLESLVPTPDMFHGAELLICDLQDIGARYYTYVWTVCMAAEVALREGLQVLVLDRPNPLGGLEEAVEGGSIEAGQESFVGWHNVSVRHGMSLAELVTLTLHERAKAPLSGLNVLECSGWRRGMDFTATGLPWVLPSPNMPTMETALIYPGQCLFEGTQLSEGRGSTRPFEFFGAPFVDGVALLKELRAEDFPGLVLRATAFKPTFQKHAGERCGGLQIHVVEPGAIRSLRSSWALLSAIWRLWPGAAKWRTETYEFVSDRPAIDMLAGGSWLREAVEAGTSIDEMASGQASGRAAFLERRRAFLRYED